uniref:Uncharacterized protein n=1 Tax=Arundo donax TaxID=35708 RepID=A0A0A9F1G9_ARUDO
MQCAGLFVARVDRRWTLCTRSKI